MCAWRTWLGNVGVGALAYFLTSTPVWLGVIFGMYFVPLDRVPLDTSKPDFLTACSRFDGNAFISIVNEGYSYDPNRPSLVAFFPGYPIIARLFTALTGWDARLSLFLISNLMLLSTFIAFSAFLRSRNPQDASFNTFLILAVFGLWPAGFFFRMIYSESTFLFFSVLVLLGIIRRWPLLILAFLTGLVTAVRPVGLAVTAALVWHILSDASRGPFRRRSLLALAYAPIVCWGLIAYVAYQYLAFDAPFAFAQTQKHWNYMGTLQYDLELKVESLLTAEPIWSVYTSDPLRTWRRFEIHDNFLFSIFFWNPISFLFALVLVFFGALKSWLSGTEFVLALFLLAIPYLTRAFEMSMSSHSRFAAIVFPVYLVLGRILRSQPEWVTWAVMGLLSVMLMSWSALFSAGYHIF